MTAALSTAAAALAGLLLVVGGHLLGGTGETVMILVAIAAGALLAARRRGRRGLHWRAAGAGLVAVVVWSGTSLAQYVGRHHGAGVTEAATAWARDHGLDGLVNRVETYIYRQPPSTAPARSLSLAPRPTVPATSTTRAAPVAPPTPPVGTTPGVTVAESPTAPTASTTPSVAAVPAPAPIPALVSPALPGEGQWTPLASAGGTTAMWATSLRPLPGAASVVASMVLIDQTHLRVGLFNGTDEPGGSRWARGDRVPADLQPALVAAMNGGFRLQHIHGGYLTEGRAVKALRAGDATLAVDRAGKLHLGVYGQDLVDDGSWLSLRQNLELLVDHGRSMFQQGLRDGVWWGANFGNAVYVIRSAVCSVADGRLAYVYVGPVDAAQLATALINVGCQRAIELDINGHWPIFTTFSQRVAAAPEGHIVDLRMNGGTQRFITGSTKEFFAFFDAAVVPAHSVLDA